MSRVEGGEQRHVPRARDPRVRVQALQHQKGLGVTGISTVFGPAVHTFPPLFRQTGVYAKYPVMV